MGFEIRFYRDQRGRELVKEWILEQTPAVQAAITSDIDLLEERGLGIGLPLVRPLKKSLFELRTEVDRNAYRIIFTIESDCFLLHSFQKNTRTISEHDMDIARRRQKLLLDEIREAKKAEEKKTRDKRR